MHRATMTLIHRLSSRSAETPFPGNAIFLGTAPMLSGPFYISNAFDKEVVDGMGTLSKPQVKRVQHAV